MSLKSIVINGILLASSIVMANSVELFQAQTKELIPQAESFDRDGEFVYMVKDVNQNIIGKLCLERIDDNERKAGFGGTVEIAVVLNEDSKVSGVLIGENQETPAWIDIVKRQKFLENWNGMSMEEVANTEVDAVSGATYTSNAISFGVKHLAQDYVGVKPKQDSATLEAERQELERDLKTQMVKFDQSSYILARSVLLIDQRLSRRDDCLKMQEIFVLEGREAAQQFADTNGLALSGHYNPRSNKPLMEAVENYKSNNSKDNYDIVYNELVIELEKSIEGGMPHAVAHANSILAAKRAIDLIKKKLDD